MQTARTTGIDFGYSTRQRSFGYAQFETRFESKPRPRFTIRVRHPTIATSLDEFLAEVLMSDVVGKADLVTLDAPVTPIQITNRPATGRSIEKRFSRGGFSNGKRGPQPSSISVPAQGWGLYCAAMRFVDSLNGVGFPLFRMPNADKCKEVCVVRASVVEVLPKLTMALMTPQDRTTSRPARHRFYGKIDNWLFPHLFDKSAVILPPGSPKNGLDVPLLLASLGSNVTLDGSFWEETARIQQEANLSLRHELIGAFVAGFQGAISFAGKSMLVGCNGDREGYYLLPTAWHQNWLDIWNAEPRRRDQVDSVYSVPVAGIQPLPLETK